MMTSPTSLMQRATQGFNSLSTVFSIMLTLLLVSAMMARALDPIPSPLSPVNIGSPAPAGQEVFTCVSNAVILPHCRFDISAGGALSANSDDGRVYQSARAG